MTRAARVDRNQSAIVEALRACGCTVQSLATVGRGCPDLLVSYRGKTVLLEVKAGKTGRLTADQVRWHGAWLGELRVVRTVDEAIEAIRERES